MSKSLPPDELTALFLKDTPWVDVRAPKEFQQGHLPGAVNLPILNNEERALVGTIYKLRGSQTAINVGHELISGGIRAERLQLWQEHIQAYPETVLYCFRGGQRSQITRRWLQETGVDRPLLPGGYKAARQFLMSASSEFAKAQKLLVISGPTGSGKTRLLDEVQAFYPVIPLETLARHRGSAFGGQEQPQPSQAQFENGLAVALLKAQQPQWRGKTAVVEDESRLIGRCVVPTDLFNLLRESEVIWVDEPLESRVENILEEYVAEPLRQGLSPEYLLAKYKKSLLSIQKKLGGLRTQETLQCLETAHAEYLSSGQLASHRSWIEKLLVYYYDPLYLNSLERRQVQVRFKGPRLACRDYIQDLSADS